MIASLSWVLWTLGVERKRGEIFTVGIQKCVEESG